MKEPRRFPVTRRSRGWGLIAGLGVLVAGIGSLGVGSAIAPARAAALAYAALMPAAVLGLLLIAISVIPRRGAHITIEGDWLRCSWQRRPIELAASRVELGRWVQAGTDAAQGLAVHVHGPEGRLCIGALGHAGEGYALRARPVRAVDGVLAAAELDALVAELGIERHPPGQELVIEVMRNGQAGLSALRPLLPWAATLATLVILSGIAFLVLGPDSVNVRTAAGKASLAGTCAVLLAGVLTTIALSTRVRLPELELRVGEQGLVLARIAGPELARARWTELGVSAQHHVQRTRSARLIFPVLELALGQGAQPFAIMTWDPHHLWQHPTPSRFWMPRLLVGSPQWPQLVATLRARGKLAER